MINKSTIFNFISYITFGIAIYFMEKEKHNNMSFVSKLSSLLWILIGVLTIYYDISNKKIDKIYIIIQLFAIICYVYFLYNYALERN